MYDAHPTRHAPIVNFPYELRDCELSSNIQLADHVEGMRLMVHESSGTPRSSSPS